MEQIGLMPIVYQWQQQPHFMTNFYTSGSQTCLYQTTVTDLNVWVSNYGVLYMALSLWHSCQTNIQCDASKGFEVNNIALPGEQTTEQTMIAWKWLEHFEHTHECHCFWSRLNTVLWKTANVLLTCLSSYFVRHSACDIFLQAYWFTYETQCNTL